MDHMWTRVASQLLARVSGPLKFRLILQPTMASFLAIRSGLADARVGKPPYFWALFWDHGQRSRMIKDGWKSIREGVHSRGAARRCVQIIVLRFIYPGEAVIVAFLLAIVPYLILRGPVTHLARDKMRPTTRSTNNPHLGNVA